jgi:hypothetical protein
MNQNWNSNCEVINESMETKSMREYMDMKNHRTWESLNRIENERGEKEKLQENELRQMNYEKIEFFQEKVQREKILKVGSICALKPCYVTWHLWKKREKNFKLFCINQNMILQYEKS